MKNSIALLLIGLFTNSLFAQIDNSPEAEIAKNLITQSFEDIWSTLDTEKISTYHTDDFIILEAGEVWTNERIAKYQKDTKARGPVPARTNRFEFISVKHYEDTVWLAYHNYASWSMNGEDRGKAQWLESAVAVKTKKGWRLQMMHSTPVRE